MTIKINRNSDVPGEAVGAPGAITPPAVLPAEVVGAIPAEANEDPVALRAKINELAESNSLLKEQSLRDREQLSIYAGQLQENVQAIADLKAKLITLNDDLETARSAAHAAERMASRQFGIADAVDPNQDPEPILNKLSVGQPLTAAESLYVLGALKGGIAYAAQVARLTEIIFSYSSDFTVAKNEFDSIVRSFASLPSEAPIDFDKSHVDRVKLAADLKTNRNVAAVLVNGIRLLTLFPVG